MARRKTHEEFATEIVERYGDVYIFHEKYTLGSNKIQVEHKVCGYIWTVLPTNLQSGKSKCPRCSDKVRRSPSEFRRYVLEITKGEFSSVEDFKGNRYMTTFMHNPCGYTFRAMSQIAEREELGCRNCSGMLIHDKERVESLLEDKYGTEYILLSEEVKNNRDEIIIRHNACGEEFITRSTDIINQGKECPKCRTSGSRGEISVDKFLKEMNLNFTREHSFFDCRHINELRFDFAVFGNDNKIDFLIEFDGKQHYEVVEFFGGVEGFKLTQLRDSIKNEYCEKKGIPLLRIPYWDFDNISSIIQNYINSSIRKVA